MKVIKAGVWLLIFLLTNCVGKTTTVQNATNEQTTGIVQSVLEENSDKVTTKESAPLLIGGRQYRGQLGERVEVEKGSWRIPNDPVNCTVDDIDKLFIMTLWIDPENPERRSSIENLESLYNLKELHIRGENLDRVDFSPISSLSNLEELEIEGNITHLPDMTRLERLNKIVIKNAALESLEGIGGAGIEDLRIRTSATGNITLKINNMTNLPNLIFFEFEGHEIDMRGIERLVSLEYLIIYDCEPFNLEGICKLNNLKTLNINLISDNPSIDFLENMPSITALNIIGNYQVLDASPLATIKTLDRLYFIKLIIKNISALDVIDRLDPLRFDKSRLYDENEKSRHSIIYEVIH